MVADINTYLIRFTMTTIRAIVCVYAVAFYLTKDRIHMHAECERGDWQTSSKSWKIKNYNVFECLRWDMGMRKGANGGRHYTFHLKMCKRATELMHINSVDVDAPVDGGDGREPHGGSNAVCVCLSSWRHALNALISDNNVVFNNNLHIHLYINIQERKCTISMSSFRPCFYRCNIAHELDFVVHSTFSLSFCLLARLHGIFIGALFYLKWTNH